VQCTTVSNTEVPLARDGLTLNQVWQTRDGVCSSIVGRAPYKDGGGVARPLVCDTRSSGLPVSFLAEPQGSIYPGDWLLSTERFVSSLAKFVLEFTHLISHHDFTWHICVSPP